MLSYKPNAQIYLRIYVVFYLFSKMGRFVLKFNVTFPSVNSRAFFFFQSTVPGYPTPPEMHPLQFVGSNPQLDHQGSDQGHCNIPVWDFLWLGGFHVLGSAPNEVADAACYRSSFEQLRMETKHPWAHSDRRICQGADPAELRPFGLPAVTHFAECTRWEFVVCDRCHGFGGVASTSLMGPQFAWFSGVLNP